MSHGKITIALAGNPNSGKTTIFNCITGTRQKVGNWPGVTVEKKEGSVNRFGHELKIIDLPGTYSLTPFSIEEIVARDFILEDNPDVVIDIIDASNLERSLYLATQLIDLERSRVVFALNMNDMARRRGLKIDTEKLSQLLNVPVINTIGNKNEGIDLLLEKAVEVTNTPVSSGLSRRVKYNKDLESAISLLMEYLGERTQADFFYDPRWAAIKLLEDDKILKDKLGARLGDAAGEIIAKAGEVREKLYRQFDDDPEIIITDERYGFIAGIIKEVLSVSGPSRVDISRKIDMVLTNRFIGFPIFIFLIWAMFQLTFSLGAYPMQWIGDIVMGVSSTISILMPQGILKDLLLNGVIAGVGSVVVFLPNILILFFCIAIFEDTGYMSRAAFLMDRIMHLIGLHGKSFIPMLMGFGCNVPAVMAARTLESEKDRILTILITPFMSCSARLPVYIVLAGAFFSKSAGTVLFSIYLFGILVSIVSGRIFRKTLLKGADAPFVMELPPYRVPMMRSLLLHMWDRSKMFLKKMGGIILVGSVLVWGLSAFPRSADFPTNPKMEKEQIEQSYMGRLGKSLSPLFKPLGIDWQGGVALISGLVAKEIVVSTMGVLYSAKDDQAALRKALKVSGMNRLSALAMMFFVLLYVPCLATVAAIKRETDSWKWTIFSVSYSTSLAWLTAFVIYQGGMLFRLG